MPYRVQLVYFRPLGKRQGDFLAFVECEIAEEGLPAIWEEVRELRRMGQLPGLRPNAGRDLFILVDVPNHPERRLQLLIPPYINDEDVTPVRIPTEEMPPLSVRLPLDEIPSVRTTTRDVLKPEPEPLPEVDDEITPVDRPVLGRPVDESE
jgi:hypothetical protein